MESASIQRNQSNKILGHLSGEAKKRPRVKWDILTMNQTKGGIGDANKIKILQKLIIRKRQPWMR